jgi:hypothetical protein
MQQNQALLQAARCGGRAARASYTRRCCRAPRYVASATIQLRRIGAFVDAVEVRNSGEIGRVCGLCLSAGRVCQGVPGRAGRHRPQWDERPVSAHSPDLRT